MAKKHIRFDWAAKKILRDKKNFGILEGFLSELLKEEIQIEGLLESESNQEEEDDKFNRVDLFAENSKGEHIINVDVSHLENGVYFYVLESGQYSSARKMHIIK